MIGSLKQAFAGGVGNVNKGFAYDASNEAVTQTRDNTSFSFTGYATIHRGYTTNALNQYLTTGTASFSYEANGKLTGDGSNSYSYGAENRIVSASTSGGTTLTYDPLGRLCSTACATYGPIYYLYDDHKHVVAKYNGGGTMLWRLFWGPGADEPVIKDGGALDCTRTRFLQSDKLGSIVAAANCGGNLQTANTYDKCSIPSSSNWGRYQYTGQAWVLDLGAN